MSRSGAIGVIAIGVILLGAGGVFMYSQLQVEQNPQEQEQFTMDAPAEKIEPKVLSATLSTGNRQVVFEKDDGSQEEYTLAQWREDVRQKFGTIKILVSHPEYFIDIDPIYVTQIIFVSLSPDGEKAFLILNVQVPVQPGGQGGISGLTLEVLDLQDGLAPTDSRSRFDIYLSPVQAFWSSDNSYVAIAMNDTTIRRSPREHIYLCQTATLDCWEIPNYAFTTNLGISSLVAELDFRDFNWDLSRDKVLFSTNTGNSPPPLGEALWELDLINQQVRLVNMVTESRDLQEQREKRIVAQVAGSQRIYEWFRCRERDDFQECNADIRSLFEKREVLPFGLVVSDEELVSFFEEKFVRFSGQAFSVVFRGLIKDYVDGETIILLYIGDSSAVPNVGTIFITQNEEGKWVVSEAIESLTAGLLRDIEQLLKKVQEIVKEQKK